MEAMAGASFLFHPPDWAGNMGLGIAALSGVPRPVWWDAVASAEAPGLLGEEQRFAVSADGAVITEPDVSAPGVAPLVAALTAELDPPFCAVTVRDEGNVWAAAANRAEVLALPESTGDTIEVSRVDDEISTRVDGDESDYRYPVLERLLEREGGMQH